MRFLKSTPLVWILSALLSIAWHSRAFGLQKIIYSDGGVLSGSSVQTWDSYRGWGIGIGEAAFNASYLGGAPVDPNISFQTISKNLNTYAGWGVMKSEDMSAYAGGYLKFWVKTDVSLKIDIKDTFNRARYLNQYGWTSADAGIWKEITIPLSDFAGLNLSIITGLFLITVEQTNRTFYVDYVRWTTTTVQTLQEIKVFPQQSSLQVGNTKDLIAVGYDTSGNPMPINPTWSVVSGNGTITPSSGDRAVFQGNGVGPAIVEATESAVTGTADINVTTSDRIATVPYNIYSDVGLPPGVTAIPQMPGGSPDPTCIEIGSIASPDPDAQEGGAYYRTVIGAAGWGGWWIELVNQTDLLTHESGILKFYARSSSNLVVKLKGGGIESEEKILTSFGWNPNNTWQEVSIPLAEFAADGVDFSLLKNVFLISTFGAPGQGTVFDIDHVRYETQYAVPGPRHVVINGRQLLIDDNLFTVRGVCYSPTPVGDGYAVFDVSGDPAIYERDFRLLRAMGVNTIRMYREPTNIAFLDAAFNHGLYVIMDYPVSHGANLPDQAVRDTIKTNFLNMVNTWKNHPAVLMWNLGNEINLHLNGLSPAEWYAFVNTCAYEAHLAEGVGYHPVISANAGVSEIGQQSYGAADSFLTYLDAWAVQFYQGPNFGNIFVDLETKTAKPVLLTEFGCDAYDMKNSREEQTLQASYIGSQVTEIEANASQLNASNISIGGCIFAWTDDWSKAQWGTPNAIHDTVGLWSNPYYYDYENISINNMNEEWWGICAVTAGTTDRTLRQAYYTVQAIWRQDPLMNAHINGGSQLTWSNVIAGENIWKVADYPITIEAADAYGDNFDVWGIQLYTDNTSSNANPRYTGGTSTNFNMVNEADTSKGLALCWTVTDTAQTPGVPVWVSDRGDTGHTEGFTDYAWRWVKDSAQTTYPFVPDEEYVRVWDQNGIYWADHVSLDADPVTPGLQPSPAVAFSPNYIYVGVRLHDSLAQAYSTNKFILEFIFP